MPVGGKSHHVVLHRATVNASVPLRTGLMLLPDENGTLSYRWELARPLAPDVSFEQVSYAEQPPDQELVWGQRDWSKGALAFYWGAGDPARYGIADKVWTATPNEISLGLQHHELTIGLPNGGAEVGSTLAWTASGVTHTAITTAPFAGAYHFSAAGMGQNDYIANQIFRTEQPAARWQGNVITVTAKVRGATGTDTGTVRLQVVETGGASTPTTNGTGVTLSTTYQDITVGVTLQADSTGAEVRIERTDAGADNTVYVDSVQVHTDVTGAVAVNAYNARMVSMIVTTNGLIAVTGRAVYLFNEVADYFALQVRFGVSITGVEVYDNRLYVALGESTAYQYSDAGDPATWTVSTLAGTGKNANFFQKALNTSGNWALAKTLNEDDVQLATDPTNSGAWGTAIEVGKDDHAMTQVYNIDGTLAVGKADGFYVYQTLDGNRFTNIFPGAEYMVNPNNFARGLMYNGQFYTVAGEMGLVRFNGENWEDLTDILQSPGFSDFGHRARAFGTDGQWLYLLIEDLNDTSLTKEGWLYKLKETRTGEWIVHQVTSLPMSDALAMYVHQPSGQATNYLFISGSISGEAYFSRVRLPNKSDTPRLALTKEMALTGEFITSYWDGNRPQVPKSFNRLTLISESLGANQSITIAYQVDNDTSWTDINSSDATFNTSPNETISFNANVTGRRIRLRFTFTTNDSTLSPVLKGFILEISWRPTRLKRWWLVASLDGSERNLQGVQAGIPAAKLVSQLDTLNDQVAPLDFDDLDGTAQRVNIVEMRELQYRTRPNPTGELQYARAVELVLQEVQT